jgi:hypothetical protein
MVLISWFQLREKNPQCMKFAGGRELLANLSSFEWAFSIFRFVAKL